MKTKLRSEQHLEFLSLKGGYTGLSESIHVKMPHCLKSPCRGEGFPMWLISVQRPTAHILYVVLLLVC